MTDDVVYEYVAQPGIVPAIGVPRQDITARHLEKLTPDVRREVKALAVDGGLFRAVNKSTATRTMNKVRDAEVKAVEQAAEGSEG